MVTEPSTATNYAPGRQPWRLMLYRKDRSAAIQSEAVVVETSRRIRSLIQLAQEAGDPELEALMREAMRWVRTNIGDQSVLERLRRWRFAGVDWNMP
jgi:hypothetical protein